MRALVYPYDENFETFIKYGDFIEEIEIVEVLSPIGWGIKEKIIGENIRVKKVLKMLIGNELKHCY